MSLVDDLRAAAQAGRQAAADVEQRPTTVTIRVETYAAPINTLTTGTTPSSTSDTVLTPSPKVMDLGTSDPSTFGGGVADDATGNLGATYYQVGPITQLWSGGGYSLRDTLAPAGAVNKRVLVKLEGPAFQSGGELFDVVRSWQTSAQSTYLIVRRTRQS